MQYINKLIEGIDSANFTAGRIGGLPYLLQLLIVVATLVIIVLLLDNLMQADALNYLENKSTLKKLNNEINLLQSKLTFNNKASGIKSKNNKFVHARNQHTDIQHLKKLNELIPNSININQYIKQIAGHVYSNNLRLISVKIKADKVIKNVAVIPVEIVLVGSYHSLAKFLADIESGKRYVEVQKITISKLKNKLVNNLQLKALTNIAFYVS